jgi:hypothetical protein
MNEFKLLGVELIVIFTRAIRELAHSNGCSPGADTVSRRLEQLPKLYACSEDGLKESPNRVRQK